MQAINSCSCAKSAFASCFACAEWVRKQGSITNRNFIYTGAASKRIFMFLPNIDIDKTWKLVEQYQSDIMKSIDKEKDSSYLFVTITIQIN